MPAKRSQNAARSRKPAAAPSRPGIAHDLVAVAIIVLAAAMVAALVLPSQAIVTHALGEGLALGFGRGAMLVPLALALFAATMFTPCERSLVARVALGLALVVISVLGLLSILSPAASDVAAVLDARAATVSGGYVGAGIAYALLILFGQPVGVVVLAGIAVSGAVVCGFSISGLVLRIRRTMGHAAERLALARQSRSGDTARVDAATEDVAAACPEEPATTFIGARKTSVLRRQRPRTPKAPGEALAAAGRTPHPALDIEGGRPARALDAPDEDSSEPTAASEGASVPDFLLKAAASRPDSGGAERPQAPATSDRPADKPRVGTKKTRPAPAVTSRPGDEAGDIKLPPLSLLKSNPNSASSASTQAELDHTARRLQATLEEFGLSSRVCGWVSGPLVTTFKIEMGEGERVNKITNLEDDIALSLAAESVRIFAPIPGTSMVGIEIPNARRQSVCLGDVLPYAQGGPLELALGRDAEGEPVVADLASMPHLLIAGATGSGKSVMINSIIMSLLMRDTPDQVRLIMIDPKRVELGGYNGLPHLYVPVVTEPRQASSALQWAVSEMDRRLKVFERAGAREIKVYNRMVADGKFADQEHPPARMPYLVIIIDELSDLMMVAGKDVEASIVRIAQLARAAGIHLIVATQRPSADVVTGLIKSNIENRVAFSVASGTDSRVILDQTGAERLLGRGDMLFRHRGKRTQRVLGCYVSDPEIEAAVDFIRGQREPDYHDEILSAVVPGQAGGPAAEVDADDDPLVWEAAQVVVDSQLGSTSGLQRRLKVGYARAGRIMDNLERKGVVGPPDGSKPREVLLDSDGLAELREAEHTFREV